MFNFSLRDWLDYLERVIKKSHTGIQAVRPGNLHYTKSNGNGRVVPTIRRFLLVLFPRKSCYRIVLCYKGKQEEGKVQ